MTKNPIRKGIKENVREEGEAVREYKKLAKKAKSLGNGPAAKLFSHISKEESHHKKELKKMLKKVV